MTHRHDITQPPTDCLAEAVALAQILDNPSLVDECDLGPLLVSGWEHRACWQAALRVHVRVPDLRGSEFVLAWGRDFCGHECTRQPNHEWWSPGRCRALSLWWSLEQARQDVPEREEYAGRRDPETGLFLRADGRRSSLAPRLARDYWVGRLRTCVEARRLISAAQEIAAYAWREDIDGALAAVTRASRLHAPKPVWERDAN